MKSKLDTNAREIKSVLSANKGKDLSDSTFEYGKTGTVAESRASIRLAVNQDLPEAVRQMNAMRTSSNDGKMVDISLAEYGQEKWGFAPDDAGNPTALYEALGIDLGNSTVNSLMNMPEFGSNYRWLVPEVIRDAVRLGLRKAPIYPKLISSEISVAQNKVTLPYLKLSDAMPKELSETETIPTGTIEYGDRVVSLSKVGTGLKVSDEVNDYVNLDVLQVYLQDMGVKMGLALDYRAILCLINGDQSDGSLSAATIGITSAGTIDYKDILRGWIRMSRLGKTPKRMVSNENIALDILDLEEFKGFSGESKLGNITLDTPIPRAQAYNITGTMPEDNTLMLIDTSSALVKLNSSALRVESERVAERGLTGTYVNMTTGFANVFRDSRILIDASLAFASNGFPSWMDLTAYEQVNFKTTN